MVVTEAAQKHFSNLLKKEEVEGMNLRVFVANAGTVHADVSVTYCPPGEEVATDFSLPFESFKLFIDIDSKDSLTDARIDFIEDALEGHLSVKAPFLKGREPALTSTLTERIQFVIDSEINPNLAGHGGKVSLIEIIDDQSGSIVVLQFGGGCHGCGMAGVTLKHGIEKTLKEKFPEIVEIRDATDHTTGADPYC
ncbi:MAG TPA: NifU family protein [Gammaproteobacteria bacterium]|nr:NifU family protein [Gammaproteobacteria bacterium]